VKATTIVNRLKWMKTIDGNLKSQLAKLGSMCFHLEKVILLLFSSKWMAII